MGLQVGDYLQKRSGDSLWTEGSNTAHKENVNAYWRVGNEATHSAESPMLVRSSRASRV